MCLQRGCLQNHASNEPGGRLDDPARVRSPLQGDLGGNVRRFPSLTLTLWVWQPTPRLQEWVWKTIPGEGKANHILVTTAGRSAPRRPACSASGQCPSGCCAAGPGEVPRPGRWLEAGAEIAHRRHGVPASIDEGDERDQGVVLVSPDDTRPGTHVVASAARAAAGMFVKATTRTGRLTIERRGGPPPALGQAENRGRAAASGIPHTRC